MSLARYLKEDGEEYHVHINEWNIDKINNRFGGSFIVIAPPGSGKTTLINNIFYYNKHKFPTAKLFIGEEDGYKEYLKIFPSIFVNNVWDEEEGAAFITRQKVLKLENHSGDIANNSIIMIDDAIENDSDFRRPYFANLFKRYSRHGNNLILLATQNAKDFPPKVRDSASYILLAYIDAPEQIKKLFDMFGGVFGDLKTFTAFLKAYGTDHSFLVIDRTNKSALRLEEKVFYYQTKVIRSDWKFGCKEYRSWDNRRDPNYNEVDEML